MTKVLDPLSPGLHPARMVRRILTPILLAGLVAAAGCERKADVGNPKLFDSDGLSFKYPGNWKVSTEVTRESAVTLRMMTVESPGQGLVMIEEFRPAFPLDLESHLGSIVDGMKSTLKNKGKGLASVEETKSTPVTRAILGAPRTGIRYRFALTVLGEKVPHTTDGYLVTLPDRALVFVEQVADEDRSLVAGGFDQILDSAAVKGPN